MTIIREPEKSELRDFIPLQTPTGRVVSPKDKLSARIGKEMLKATKKQLPFADAATRADIKDLSDAEQKRWEREGVVKDWNPEIEWNKYSDLDNFEVIDEGEIHDRQASKEHKLSINMKFTTYKYKGFSNRYMVMESIDKAIQRALDKIERRNIQPHPVTPVVEVVKGDPPTKIIKKGK